MYCIKCGAENPEAAIYCQKCGFQFEAEEETRVGPREPPPDVKLFVIRPTMLFIRAGYAAAVAAAFLLVVVLYYLGLAAGIQLPWWLSIIAGLSLLLIPLYYHLKRNMVCYTLTNSRIEIDEGFISRTTRNVPLGKIQDVTVSSGVLQRLLGFGNLVIDNAANEAHEKIVLKNVDAPKQYADILLKEMRRLNR